MLLLASPGTADAQPVCRGKDLLSELEKSNPALHKQVLEAARTERNSEAQLWRVEQGGSHRGAANISWLFGTIHLTDDRVHALSHAVRGALADARVLALEIDDLDDSTMQSALKTHEGLLATADRNHGLDRLLSPSEWAALREVSRQFGFPEEQAARTRPWRASTWLSRPVCEIARQGAGLKPLDMALRDSALAAGSRIVGLETIAGHWGAMASLSQDTELAWLRSSLALHPRIEDLTETLVQLYLNRRIGAAWQLEQAFAGAAAMGGGHLHAVQQALVVHRNRGMRDASLPLLAVGGAFIAVGALHLPGKDGLVQLFREAGFTVTAIE